MTLERDFQDFIELLNKHEVDYMVVGGYALAFHGEPRTTGDLEIWINLTESNASKMVTVMNDFGFASVGFKKEDFTEPGIINQIGQPPLRIDILNEIEGVEYTDAIKDRQFFKSGNADVPFIGVADFIKNKQAVGREKDLKDVKKIETKRIKKKNIKKGNRKGRGLR